MTRTQTAQPSPKKTAALASAGRDYEAELARLRAELAATQTNLAQAKAEAAALEAPAPAPVVAPRVVRSMKEIRAGIEKRRKADHLARTDWWEHIFNTEDKIFVLAFPNPTVRARFHLVVEVWDGTRILPMPPIEPGMPVLVSRRARKEILRNCRSLLDHYDARACELLTREEADGFFTERAKLLGIAPSEVQNEQINAERAYLTKQKPDEPPPIPKKSQNLPNESDIIQPWILSLMQACDAAVDEKDRKPANEVLVMLDNARETLTVDDLQHVMARCAWSSVGDYALERLKELKGVNE